MRIFFGASARPDGGADSDPKDRETAEGSAEGRDAERTEIDHGGRGGETDRSGNADNL